MIKQIKESDNIKDALALVWEVFSEFEAPDYPKSGIETFRAFIEYDSIIQKITSGHMNLWGFYEENELRGIIGSRDVNHISLLFVKKVYFRQGIARKLFEAYVAYCKDEMGKQEITVNSSPYAVEVYHKLGFKNTDVEQETNGIRYTPMKYEIKKN